MKIERHDHRCIHSTRAPGSTDRSDVIDYASRAYILMKSMKERRVQRKAKRAEKRVRKLAVAKGVIPENRVPVNASLLAPTNSYGRPDFVHRGFYIDTAFTCKDCGKKEVWTSRQQKWWYEVAKGDMFTVATRCRPCRRKESNRKAEARSVHLDGLKRKRAKT